MSTDAQRRTIETVLGGEGPVTPLRVAKARESGGSVYGLIPRDKARVLEIEQSTDLAIGYHHPSRTILQTPARTVASDHWAAQLPAIETEG